jgi:LacI family transcriptional regulator
MLEGGPVRPQEDGHARQPGATTARPPRDGSRLIERKTTLAAIAAAAGVSLPTVSKVVNGRPDVAAETRARVERLLDEYNYARPGPRRQRRAGLIDLVLAGLDSPWAVEILRGVEEWGAAHETGVAVSSVRHGSARPASWTSTVASHDSSGVILVTTKLADDQLMQLRSAGIPLVVVDPANTPPADIPSVGATNWAAASRRLSTCSASGTVGSG